jgi:hypothetical protein
MTNSERNPSATPSARTSSASWPPSVIRKARASDGSTSYRPSWTGSATRTPTLQRATSSPADAGRRRSSRSPRWHWRPGAAIPPRPRRRRLDVLGERHPRPAGTAEPAPPPAPSVSTPRASVAAVYSGLGERTTVIEAETAAGGRLLLPAALGRPDAVFRQGPWSPSATGGEHPQWLVMEVVAPSTLLVEKIALTGSKVHRLTVNGHPGGLDRGPTGARLRRHGPGAAGRRRSARREHPDLGAGRRLGPHRDPAGARGGAARGSQHALNALRRRRPSSAARSPRAEAGGRPAVSHSLRRGVWQGWSA